MAFASRLLPQPCTPEQEDALRGVEAEVACASAECPPTSVEPLLKLVEPANVCHAGVGRVVLEHFALLDDALLLPRHERDGPMVEATELGGGPCRTRGGPPMTVKPRAASRSASSPDARTPNAAAASSRTTRRSSTPGSSNSIVGTSLRRSIGSPGRGVDSTMTLRGDAGRRAISRSQRSSGWCSSRRKGWKSSISQMPASFRIVDLPKHLHRVGYLIGIDGDLAILTAGEQASGLTPDTEWKAQFRGKSDDQSAHALPLV